MQLTNAHTPSANSSLQESLRAAISCAVAAAGLLGITRAFHLPVFTLFFMFTIR